MEVADVVGAEPPEYDDGTVEEGEYEAVTQFCCCGEEWTFVRETVASEYARMEEHLKPLQWPDMEQPS